MRSTRMNIRRWITIALVAAVALHGVLPMALAGTGSTQVPEAGTLEAALRIICTGHGAQQIPDQSDQQTPAYGDECRSCPLPCTQTLSTPATFLADFNDTGPSWSPTQQLNLFSPRTHVPSMGSRAPPYFMRSML